MSIKGDLGDLYDVGVRMLPEVGNCFAKAANVLHEGADGEKANFTRSEYSPNPALEGETVETQGHAYVSWSRLRDEVQSILKTNAENLQSAATALIIAADSMAAQDGYNSDEIASAKEDADGPDHVTPNGPFDRDD